MNSALVRTLSFLLLMLIGYFLKGKIPHEQRGGIKQIILNLALPAVIFISLQGVKFSWEMIMLPVAAITFNILLFYLSGPLLLLLGFRKESSAFRSMRLLLPSLAPGLSCFPFLLEYLGEDALAKAAFADLGNKVFVLMVLYAIAMRWHAKSSTHQSNSKELNFRKFLRVMINEPVNLAIAVALILVALGLNYQIFPLFIQSAVDKLAFILTPLILLFIGLSVKLNWRQARMITSVLLLRAALAFLLSAGVIFTFQIADPVMLMLIVLFPQSSVSFWPFLHIESVRKMEDRRSANQHTFDADFAMSTLAMSLPLSTIVILGLCTFQNHITSGIAPLGLFLVFLFLAVFPGGIRLIRKYLSSGILARSESNN